MKNIVLFFAVLLLCSSLWSQRNWTLYTNTTHMRDLVVYEGNIVIATWGGLEYFDTRTNSYIRTLTTIDGMRGNNISRVNSLGDNELLIGVNGQGIDRLKNNNFGVSLTADSGLPALRMNAIYSHKDIIYFGSDRGLTLFTNEESFPFPLFKKNYNVFNSPFTEVNSIVVDDKDYLYIGTNIGFSVAHTDSLDFDFAWRHIRLNDNESVNSLDTKGDLLVLGTNQRLISFTKENINNIDNWTVYFSESRFSKVLIDNGNNNNTPINDFIIYAIFGSWEELGDHYEPDHDSRSLAIIEKGEAKLHYLGSDEIFSRAASNILLFEDKIFLTTWGGGIYFYNKRLSDDTTVATNWHNFTPNSIHTNTIVDFAVDNNIIWIIDGITQRTGSSTAGTGVSFMDAKTGIWTHYNVRNSDIISNNIRAIGIDSMNRKWFGAWWTEPPGAGGSWNGISVLDDSNPQNPIWHTITKEYYPIINPTISSILRVQNQIWVSSAANSSNEDPGGINVFNNNIRIDYTFAPRISPIFDITDVHKIDGYSYFGSSSMGLRIWRSNNAPETNGAFWETPPMMNSGRVYKIASYQGQGFTQVWFASTAANDNSVIWKEIRNNRITWYRSTSARRKEVYLNGSWNDDPNTTGVELYFAGEERVFGGNPTTPTSIAIDTLGRVWIGSTDRGITMYDINRNTYANITMSNSPLTTNNILSLAFQESTGLLLIGTAQGLLTTQIVSSTDRTDSLNSVEVFPNPFRPELGDVLSIQITYPNHFPRGVSEARIFDVNGQLITTLEESNRFNGFTWDGNNNNREKVSSGIYFYLIVTEVGESARGRIVLIR
ncbi:MAG: hypothetical protein FWG98_10235 [Candidatus Cloacimonetes bacterium]|nr:hypothetical protein [Candidatus Cloacimonadota bacterium]